MYIYYHYYLDYILNIYQNDVLPDVNLFVAVKVRLNKLRKSRIFNKIAHSIVLNLFLKV